MPTNPAGVLYGTIMVGTLLAAESAKRETYARTIAATLLAMLLLWLVRGYTIFTARRLREGAPLTLASLRRTMIEELSIMTGGSAPLLALLISWFAGATLSTAVAAAVWTAAGVILIVEAAAGVRARQKGRELIGQTLLGAFLGFLVIALRLVLH